MPKTMIEFLKQNHQSAIPEWLTAYRPGRDVDFNAVRNTACVYYPGAGNDGQPVHTFSAARAAFLYVYVDYMLSRREAEAQLAETPFRGYRKIGLIDMKLADLTPKPWSPHIRPSREQIEGMRHLPVAAPYGFMAVFEREDDLTDEYGAKRFAVIFIGGDGMATYDAVFANGNMIPPLAIVLQDHGFGGNYDRFGKGGLLEKIAIVSGIYPKLLLTGANTETWDGYIPLDAPGVLGGMHRQIRRLFIRKND